MATFDRKLAGERRDAREAARSEPVGKSELPSLERFKAKLEPLVDVGELSLAGRRGKRRAEAAANFIGDQLVEISDLFRLGLSREQKSYLNSLVLKLMDQKDDILSAINDRDDYESDGDDPHEGSRKELIRDGVAQARSHRRESAAIRESTAGAKDSPGQVAPYGEPLSIEEESMMEEFAIAMAQRPPAPKKPLLERLLQGHWLSILKKKNERN